MNETESTPPYLEPGLYEHFKGGVYDVLHLAKDSETEDRWLVIYRSLATAAIYARPYDMFIETVTVDGEERPRFKPSNRLV